MIASDRCVVQAGERMMRPSSWRTKPSPAAMPQPSMSKQSSGAIHAKFGVVDARLRSAGSDSSGTRCAAQ